MQKEVENNQTLDGGSKWQVPFLRIPRKQHWHGNQTVAGGSCQGNSKESVLQGLSWLSHLFAPDLRGLNTKHLI